jgi:DNA invertase Pin-like site-specific DNA recombinase
LCVWQARKGAHLRVLEPEVSAKGPVGKMVLTVLGMVAEMEVGFIRERQRAGIEAAKAKGVYKGRPVTLDHAKIIDLHKKAMAPRRSPRPWDAPGARSIRCSA